MGMLDPIKKDWDERVSRHEAGHFIAGHAQGFRAGPIRRQGFSASCGIDLSRPLTAPEVEDYCRQCIIISLAGACAECVSDGGAFDDTRAGGLLFGGAIVDPRYSSDVTRAREHAQILNNLSGNPTDDNWRKILCELGDQTGVLLVTHVSALNAVHRLVMSLGDGGEIAEDKLKAAFAST